MKKAKTRTAEEIVGAVNRTLRAVAEAMIDVRRYQEGHDIPDMQIGQLAVCIDACDDLKRALSSIMSEQRTRYLISIGAKRYGPKIVTVKKLKSQRGASLGGDKRVERIIVTAKHPRKLRRASATR